VHVVESFILKILDCWRRSLWRSETHSGSTYGAERTADAAVLMPVMYVPSITQEAAPVSGSNKLIRARWLGRSLSRLPSKTLIQVGNGLGFALEALLAHRVRGKRSGEDLERDCAVEARIPRTIHLAHPAHTDRCEDLIGPQSCPCS